MEEEAHFSSKKSAEEEDQQEEDYSDITLRLFDLSDVDDFISWATDENVCKFTGWYPTTYASKETTMNYFLHYVIPHPWFRAVCLKNRVIGEIVVTLDKGSGGCKAEVGYSLGSKYWGKGIMTKALKMAASTVFVDWPDLRRLEAVADVDNLASQRVLEKAGFEREGVLRSYIMSKGKLMDMVMFSLLPSDPFLKSLMFGYSYDLLVDL